MANDDSHHFTASRCFFLPNVRRLVRATAALFIGAALLQLCACSTTPAPPQRANWEPGCTGPASFCVPFFGP
jgi:hypothetical protein